MSESICVGCGCDCLDVVECGCGRQEMNACEACLESDITLVCGDCRDRAGRVVPVGSYACRDFMEDEAGAERDLGETVARERLGRGRPRNGRTVQGDGTGIAGTDSFAPRVCRAASSGACLPGASPRRHVRRPAALHWGAAKRPCRCPADNRSGRPVQGRRQGGGVQPPGLAATAPQASSLARSGPRCEASGLVTTREPVTGNRRIMLIHNVESGFWVRRRWPDGQVPSGANVQPQDFSSGNLLRSGRLLPTGRGRVRGATFRAGGTLYLRAL